MDTWFRAGKKVLAVPENAIWGLGAGAFWVLMRAPEPLGATHS